MKDESQRRSHGRRLYFFQRVGDCGLNRARAIAPEFFIQCLQPLNQIGDMLARIRTAGCGAKMGSAPEGPVRINGAAAISSKHGT